jgi:hypothetical protein
MTAVTSQHPHPSDHPDLQPGVVYADRTNHMSRLLGIPAAAAQAGVTIRTVNRWITTGKLAAGSHPLLPGRYVREDELLACESRCHFAARRGRPGPRVRLDVLT